MRCVLPVALFLSLCACESVRTVYDSNGKAVPVDITAGIRTAGEVQVLSGLVEGDTIITSGTLQLRTDLPVTLDEIE